MSASRNRPASSILPGLAVVCMLVLAGCHFYEAPQGVMEPEATFRNPLNNSGPDPWMTYYEGNYYLAATTWGDPFVGLTMRKARTVEELKKAAPERIWQDWTPERCCNFWAPEFFLLDGPSGRRWYGYYTAGPAGCCDNQRVHVIEGLGSDPLGPYAYKGQIDDSSGDRTIDASVLQLDGALYLLYAARIGDEQRIFIAAMENPWTLAGPRVQISAATYSWERQGGHVNQGPVALQHEGKTFIIYSASYCGGAGYKLGMLTYVGSNPLSADSWAKYPLPVFQGTAQVFAPGHNTFFRSPDGTEDWIVYHASDSANGGCDMNRTPRMQRFGWKGDGTPDFGSPASPDAELEVPSGE